MLTHSHAGLSRLFPLTLPAPEKQKKTKNQNPPRLSAFPTLLSAGPAPRIHNVSGDRISLHCTYSGSNKSRSSAHGEKTRMCPLFLRSNVCTHTEKKKKKLTHEVWPLPGLFLLLCPPPTPFFPCQNHNFMMHDRVMFGAAHAPWAGTVWHGSFTKGWVLFPEPFLVSRVGRGGGEGVGGQHMFRMETRMVEGD